MSRPVPTAKFLEEWQDGLIESARIRLRKDGEIMPLVWILTYAELVPQDLRDQCKPIEKRGQLWVSDDRFSILVLPISHDFKHLRRMLWEISDEPSRERMAIIESVAPRVPGYTPDKLDRILVQSVLKAQDWDPKDIVASYIRRMLERSNAVAYVKNMDGYTLHQVAPPGSTKDEAVKNAPKSLEHEPSASEALISLLEHAEGCRMVMHPYHRRQRNTGKLKSWGNRQVTFTPRGSDDLSGRFMWMLPVPEHPPIEVTVQ